MQRRLCWTASDGGCSSRVGQLAAALPLDLVLHVCCRLGPALLSSRCLPCCCCRQVGWGVVLEVLCEQAQAVPGCHAGVPVAVAQVARHRCHNCGQLSRVRFSDGDNLRCRRLACGQ